MPILLDKPEIVHLGHGLPEESSPEVKIISVEIHIEEKRLVLRCQYGETVDGIWMAGRSVIDQVVEDKGPYVGPGGIEVEADLAFSKMAFTTVTQNPKGSNLYGEVAGAFYELLLSTGIYQGTIL